MKRIIYITTIIVASNIVSYNFGLWNGIYNANQSATSYYDNLISYGNSK